jgi:hypothetical protein
VAWNRRSETGKSDDQRKRKVSGLETKARIIYRHEFGESV